MEQQNTNVNMNQMESEDEFNTNVNMKQIKESEDEFNMDDEMNFEDVKTEVAKIDDEEITFNNFLKSFSKDFNLAKHRNFITKESYFNQSCVYNMKKEEFYIKYKISDKRYHASITKKHFNDSIEYRILYKRLFKLDEKNFEMNQKMFNKPKFCYMQLNFIHFRLILAKYLYDNFVKSNITLENVNMDINNLLSKPDFVLLLKKFTPESSENTYGLD